MGDKTAITETSTERRIVSECGYQIFISLPTHREISPNWPTFWTCTEKTPPHFRENWRAGARRLTRSKWSSESSERVRKEQRSISKPSPTDRAYYPTTTDIRNHMYKAKVTLQLSKYDQENLTLKIEWKRLNSDDYHFFQPYVSEQSWLKPGVERLPVGLIRHKLCYGFISNSGKGNSWPDTAITLVWLMLYIIQWSTNCPFSLCVCVHTNLGYSVAAQFIAQSESVECIAEALNVLKEWIAIGIHLWLSRCRVFCTEVGIS